MVRDVGNSVNRMAATDTVECVVHGCTDLRVHFRQLVQRNGRGRSGFGFTYSLLSTVRGLGGCERGRWAMLRLFCFLVFRGCAGRVI